MRIGIFGGSFNPIHVGHIALARQLRQLASLDEVWLMVSPQNPLKQGSTELLDDRLRLLMTRIALHGEEGIRACDTEMHMPRPSYTWDTLQRLKTLYPGDTFTDDLFLKETYEKTGKTGHFYEYEGMFHTFAMFPIPEGFMALKEIVKAIKKQ